MENERKGEAGPNRRKEVEQKSKAGEAEMKRRKGVEQRSSEIENV